MARAERINDTQVIIQCPGCDCIHAFDERWSFNGDLERPTFMPSLLVRWAGGFGPERRERVCHSFVTDGRIQFLPDSTHHLAGQTVDLPDAS